MSAFEGWKSLQQLQNHSSSIVRAERTIAMDENVVVHLLY